MHKSAIADGRRALCIGTAKGASRTPVRVDGQLVFINVPMILRAAGDRWMLRRLFYVKRSLCTWIFIAMRIKSARLRAPMRSITHDR
jgi:hypothetical protein